MLLQLAWKIAIPTKIWSWTVSSSTRKAKKCQKDWKIILTQWTFATALVLMLLDCISSTLLLSELTHWTFLRKEWNKLLRISSYLGIMPTDSWSRIFLSLKPKLTSHLFSLRISKISYLHSMLPTVGSNPLYKPSSLKSANKCKNTNSTMSSHLW